MFHSAKLQTVLQDVQGAATPAITAKDRGGQNVRYVDFGKDA